MTTPSNKSPDAPADRQRGCSPAVVLIPAYNEEASLGPLLEELRSTVPDLPILVVNDGSTDNTGTVAAAHGATVLDLPCNLGVGGAVQTGFAYAVERGYRSLVRIDGDGQHPPAEIPRLLQALSEERADMVVGSRFLAGGSFRSGFLRTFGIRVLALFLSVICRKKVTDPTSGFFALNRTLLHAFAKRYPTDYPEPEALALMRRQGYSFVEVPVAFRSRRAGHSSIQSWGTLYYALKVGLALLVDRARPVDPRLSRAHLRNMP